MPITFHADTSHVSVIIPAHRPCNNSHPVLQKIYRRVRSISWPHAREPIITVRVAAGYVAIVTMYTEWAGVNATWLHPYTPVVSDGIPGTKQSRLLVRTTTHAAQQMPPVMPHTSDFPARSRRVAYDRCHHNPSRGASAVQQSEPPTKRVRVAGQGCQWVGITFYQCHAGTFPTAGGTVATLSDKPTIVR